jgi:TonB family protein
MAGVMRKSVASILLLISEILPQPANAAAEVGGEVPPMRLVDLYGGGYKSLQDFRGRAVMITVWATWCGVCRKQLPQMMRLQRDLGPEGLTIAAIGVDESPEPLKRHLQELERSNGRPGFAVLYDEGKQAKEVLGYRGVPNNFIADRNGVIVEIIRGGFDAGGYDDTRRFLKAVMDGNKPVRRQAPADFREAAQRPDFARIDPSRVIISEGILDRAAIARGLDAASRKAWQCYEAELKEHPVLSGDILIRFTIGAEGRVEKAVVEQSYTENEALDRCTAEAVAAIIFPAPRAAPVTARYPFVFRRR